MSAAAPIIGVLGHFAATNLGDDSCPTALLYHVRRRVPHARFVLFCRYPRLAAELFGCTAYPVRRHASHDTDPWRLSAAVHAGTREPATEIAPTGWRARARAIAPLRAAVNAVRTILAGGRAFPAECRFLWHSYHRLREVDVLLVTGSNPIFDYFGGFWQFPYTVWKWTVLARLTRTTLAFVSVGAGPIVSRHSGRLLAWSLRRARYVSFRDRGSASLMRRHGFRGIGTVRPDLAHSLPVPPAERPSAGASRVGINPMIVHNEWFWPDSDARVHRNYVESLAAFTAGLLRDGYDVFFFGTQKDDRVSATEVQIAMRETLGSSVVPEFVYPDTVNGLVELCTSADILVTTRFHGAVFGILTGRPTLAVCYQAKTREVLEEAGLGAFAFPFEEVSATLIRSRFDRLHRERHDVEARLRDHASAMRARLDEQYDDLVGMLNGGYRAQARERKADHMPVAAQLS